MRVDLPETADRGKGNSNPNPRHSLRCVVLSNACPGVHERKHLLWEQEIGGVNPSRADQTRRAPSDDSEGARHLVTVFNSKTRLKSNILSWCQAAGVYPFPFRTRKSSPPAPMVLLLRESRSAPT